MIVEGKSPETGNTKLYKYRIYRTLPIILGMLTVSLVSMGLGMKALTGDVAFAGVFLLLSGVWFLFLTAFASLMRSSIVVNEAGITARKFGLTLKFIEWRDIKNVTNFRSRNAPPFRSLRSSFRIYDSSVSGLLKMFVNLGGPIVFTSEIEGLQGLLAQVNEAASRYQFPLFVLKREAGNDLAGTIPFAKGDGIAAKTHKVKVDRF
jgi:hypothetical protein